MPSLYSRDFESPSSAPCFRFLNLFGGGIAFCPGDNGIGKYTARGPSSRNHQTVSCFPSTLLPIVSRGKVIPILFLRHKPSLSPTGLWLKVQSLAIQGSWTCNSKPVLCWSALSFFSLGDEYFYLNGVKGKGLKKKIWISVVISDSHPATQNWVQILCCDSQVKAVTLFRSLSFPLCKMQDLLWGLICKCMFLSLLPLPFKGGLDEVSSTISEASRELREILCKHPAVPCCVTDLPSPPNFSSSIYLVSFFLLQRLDVLNGVRWKPENSENVSRQNKG